MGKKREGRTKAQSASLQRVLRKLGQPNPKNNLQEKGGGKEKKK